MILSCSTCCRIPEGILQPVQSSHTGPRIPSKQLIPSLNTLPSLDLRLPKRTQSAIKASFSAFLEYPEYPTASKTMAPQHEPKVRLQARGNVPNKTTTIILASALTVGIIMLILGCYFIYQLYMNRIGRRQQRTRSHRRSNARNQAAAHAAPALELRDIIPSHDATRTGTRNSGQRNETTTTYRDIWPDTIPGPSRNSNRMSSQLSQGHGNVRMNGNRGSKRTSRTSGPGAQRHFSPDYPDEDYMRVRSAVRFSGPTPLPAMPPQRYVKGHRSQQSCFGLEDELTVDPVR